MFNKRDKRNLDEMQELRLLKIESRGCWIAFWGLFLAFIGQTAFFPGDIKRILPEGILFFVLTIYLLIACRKESIWDRHLQPTPKANFLVSLAAALLSGALIGIASYVNYGSAAGAFATFAMMAVFMFILLFIVLSLSLRRYLKKQEEESRRMDAEEIE